MSAPRPSGKKSVPGTIPTPVLDRPPGQVDGVGAVRKGQPREEAALRPRPAHTGRHRALERRQQPLALAPVERPRTRQLLVDPAAPGRLLEQPLAERAGALVGELLRRDEPGGDLGRADGPAEPHAGEERLRRRARLHDDVRGEAPEARQRLVGEAELAVGDVLDDQEAVAARQLDQRRPPLGREAHAGRVLVVRDRVDELRAQPGGEPALQLVDLEPVLVERHGDEARLEAPERLDRAQVRRPLDDDEVAGVEERLPDQLQRLDRAARDRQLVLGGAAALQRLEPVGERVERPGQPARRRVLECAQLAGLDELLEQRRDPLARERLRVGEAAGERDHVGHAEERQDGGDALADIAPRARRGERLEAC